MGALRMLRRRMQRQISPGSERRTPQFELLEPRLLLDADLTETSSLAVQDGLTQFGARIGDFLDAQNVLNDTRIPFVLQFQQGADGAKNVAPTLGSLFSLQVDTNGPADGGIDATLQGLDANSDGTVDAGEFIQGWLIGEINQQLALYPNHDGIPDTTQFVEFLFPTLPEQPLDTTMMFDQPGGHQVTVELQVTGATDLTENDPLIPSADLMFGIDFTLTADQNLAIDLGTEADALKLLPYSGNIDSSPTIPVEAKLDFGFTFGVHTSGQGGSGQPTLDEYDFFVRDADPLNISARSDGPGDDTLLENIGFNLNIGFLGASVSGGTIDFQAAVTTLLIDPDSPAVLGFTPDQYGVEQTSGVVTSFNAIPSADLTHEAGFVLRIGNAGIATEVKVLDDNDNGTDLDSLVDDVNAALGAANLGDLVEASRDGSDHLVFTLVETTDNPLGFANESYSGTGVLTSTPDSGDATYPYEFGSNVRFLLSVDGAVPTLVDVRFPDPAQSDIGFDAAQTATLPDLVGENDAAGSGYLSGNASFDLAVTLSDGTVLSETVSVIAATNIVTDINVALVLVALDTYGPAFAGKTLADYIHATTEDAKIALSRVDPSVSAIEIANPDPVTLSDIGFVAGQKTTLTIEAANTVSNASLDDGKAATDDHAHLKITVNGTSQVLDIAPGSADGTALATAIDNALAGAGLAVDASYDSANNKIVLTAQDSSVLAFSLTTVNENIDDLVDDVNRALTQAGLDVTASTDGTHLTLTATGGKSLEITHTLTLDAGVTYQELVDTPTDKLFHPEPDPASNISFDLPVTITPGLNYNPPDVAIVGNFSPFGEFLAIPDAVAQYDASVERFHLEFNLTPDPDHQDTPVPAETVAPAEHVDLVNLAESLNFNLVTADSMVGLIKGLGAALQQIAASGLFAGYGIPFADAAWSDLLNYSDADAANFSGLIDRSLIYETDGDGVAASGEALGNEANRLLKRIVVDGGQPGTADDTVYLAPNFVTAQGLAGLLSSLLGVPNDATGINANYDPNPILVGNPPTPSDDPTEGVNELTYTVNLISNGRTDISIADAPFEYDVDLSPFAKLTLKPSAPPDVTNANKEVALQGHTGLSMTFGIVLSPPGAVILDTTDLADLNGGAGVDIKTEYAVTGETGVRSIYGLTKDSEFQIQIDSGDKKTVNIYADDTADNTDFLDLIFDIRGAINSAIGADIVDVGYLAGTERLAIQRHDPGDIKIYVDSSDPFVTELGFPNKLTEVEPIEPVAFHTLIAQKDAPRLVGRLTGDATFGISVDGNTYQVTVPSIDTQDYTLLSYSNLAGVFNVNDTITGGKSGATAKVLAVNGSVGSLRLNYVHGAFEYGEELQVGGSAVALAGLTMSVTGNRSMADLVEDVNKALADVHIQNKLGFAPIQSATAEPGSVVLTGVSDAELDLPRDVVFTIAINDGTPVSVTVDKGPGPYSDINALITAVNQGLMNAGLNSLIVADSSGDRVSLHANDSTVAKIEVQSAGLATLVNADFDGTSTAGFRLVLTALDSTTQFSVTAYGLAQSQLGLPSGTTQAVAADFVIYDSRGGRYVVSLTDLPTNIYGEPEVQAVKDRINDVTGTAQTELGFDESQEAVLPDLIAENVPTAYDLTGYGDATFDISVLLDDGSLLIREVVVEVADTTGNSNGDDLASSINAQILVDAPALADFIRAVYEDGKIKFRAVDPSVSGIELDASGSAVGQIGFATSQVSTLALTAINDPISSFDLTYDAHFLLTVAYDGSEHTVEVTVPADMNANAQALAADIDAAIDAALGVDKIGVMVESGKLVLKANDTSVYALSISTKMVTVDFNSTQTGLRLVDHTGGAGQFRAETINGSRALLTLGLFRPDNTGTDYEKANGDPYLIEGGQIGLTHLDDRFFVRDAELWGAVGLQTPNPILGTGLFGVVGVDTSLTGSMYAQFTADIKDPDTGIAGGTATLLDLYNATKQGRLTQDAIFTVTIGGDSTVVTVPKSATLDDPLTPNVDETNKTLEDLVADVNAALDTAGLAGSIKAVAAETRIEFISLQKDDLLTDDIDESVPFSITAGAGAAGLGLSGTLDSVKVNDTQTVDAHSAPRYAIEDPVVSQVSELGFGDYLPFSQQFMAGTMIYGWADTDDNDLPDTLTGSALILGVEPGLLTLGHVEGTFANADWLFNSKVLSDVVLEVQFPLFQFAIGAESTGSEATPKANFGPFTLGVDVQQTADEGFGGGFGTLFGGQHYDVDFALTDFGNPFGNGSLTDPTAPKAVFDDLEADTGGSTGLYAFKDLDYGDINSALQGLLAVINDVNTNFTLLNQDLPAINRSVGDLLNLVVDFERGADNADDAFANAILALEPEGTDIPALTLQDIPRALRSAFGLPSGPDTVEPDPANHNWIELDFDNVNNMLLMDLSLEQTISTKLGLDIGGLVDGDGNPLPDLTSGGVLKVSGALDVNLNVGIDLNPPADPNKPNNDAYLFDTSNIAATLHVEGEGQEYQSGSETHDGMGLVFRASLGPLAVFIQDGDVVIDASFALPGLDFGAGTDKKLINDPAPENNVEFSDWQPAQKSSNIDIDLPMFYGGEGPNNYLDDFTASGPIESISVHTPDFSGIAEDIKNGATQYDPFDNILLAFDTLNVYLESLSDTIAGDVLGINLPFVGDQLADLLFIETFRNNLYTTLKNGIENKINPTPDDVKPLLETALAGFLDAAVVYTPSVSGPIDTWSRQWSVSLHKDKTYTLDDFDIGISNLGFDVDVPVTVDFVWDFDITFGVNFAEGAYIDVSSGNELGMDLILSLPNDGGAWSGTFGFLKVSVTDPDNNTGAKVNFDVDVQKGANPVATHLGFSDIGDIKPVATVVGSPLDGAADAATLHLVTTAIKGLPSLTTDLVIDWSLESTEPSDPPHTPILVSSLSGDGVASGVTRIALDTMSLDAKSVAQSLLGPVFDTIEQIIQPFMPVVDTLTYPIPVLSDIAGKPFTLLDLAGIFGSVDPRFIDAVKDILNVIKTIDNIIELPVLPLGSLTLYSSTIKNLTTLNDPSSELADITIGAWDPSSPNKDVTGWDFDKSAFDQVIESNGFLKDLRDGKLAKGLSMPVFTDPRQGVKLLLDQNATMIDYLIPPLSVDFNYTQVFPIFGPLALSIEIGFGFELDLHSVGFDTYGYQRYADGGFRDAAVIFDGFYLNDLNKEGVDAPEITFTFSLIGAAELNLGIARAGVKGGVDAKIFFDWNDPVPDGHVHVSEMWGNMWANNYDPLAVFDVSGALTFQMAVFLEISLIGFKQDFPITPETTLFSFDIPFERPAILATQADDTLILNMGPNSKDRLRGDTSDGNEGIEVSASGDTVHVTSQMFGVDDAQEFNGIKHIVALGGQGDDRITLDLTGSTITYELEGGPGDDYIEVTAGGGGGTIRGGVGNDTLKGGDGDDVIYGEEGNDTIDGGGGSDILFGDFGRVFENLATADPLVTSRITDADGADLIHGGDGDDIIIGGGGNDKLFGDGGDDVILGDGGRFAYEGDFDTSNLIPNSYTSFFANYPQVGSDYVDPATISDSIDAVYDDLMMTFSATDLGYGGNDTISGGADNDVIFGGTGDDTVNGDAGNDIVLGGKGFDDLHGGPDNDMIFGNEQADTIYGDDGNDAISGGAGNDYLHGNAGDDVMKGDSGADVMFGDQDSDIVLGQTEPDILFGGAGNDLVVGGTGHDIMFGDDGIVAKLDPDYDPATDPDSAIGYKVIFNDTLINRSVVDSLLATVQDQEGDSWWDDDIRSLDLIQTYVQSGDGNDYLSGDAADDFMFGGGGNDTMGGDVDPRLASAGDTTSISQDVMIGDGGRITFDRRRFRSVETVIGDTTGSPFDDTIYGDNGNDYLLGGRGNDILAGGHGPNRGPTDPDASDNDVILGDNGELIFADDTIEGNFGRLELIRTTDTANDTGGADTAYGEEGADIILGGVNNDDGLGEPEIDRLYGDYYDYTLMDVPAITLGNDVILGDNGLLDFALGSDTDLDTLDLIHSEPYAVTDWSTEPPTLDTGTILGGVDIIDGSFGYDVLIGGVAGDTMYGDDPTASNAADDGEDILLGDNGDLFLIGTEGRLLVQVATMTTGTAVDLITTTDTEEATGGPDIMSGNAKADILLGGVNNDDGNLLNGVEEDVMYGDRAVPTEASIGDDADDILLGDNGLLDFTYDPADYPDDDQSVVPDTDRNTLDLIRSSQDALGGIDVISGNRGMDVAIGGTAGDFIYGDDATESAYIDGMSRDEADLLLGDNADIFLVAANGASGGDVKLVLDAAVKTIRTTDTVDPDNTGGSDTISGNAQGDIIAGGVYGDTIYGDQASPDAVKYDDDGDDIILGDNGAFEWLSAGRLSEITGIDIAANNPDLVNNDGKGWPDTDLTTLDLITTEQPTSGGRDLIYGDQGQDFVFGGTDADTIYGDDGTLDEISDSANNDLLFGDHGRIYPQFSTLADFNSRNFFAIDIGNADGGAGDRMWGEEGDDTMLGQQGDDRMWGGAGDDDMTGGHNVSGGYDELTAPAINASLEGAGIAVPPIDDVNDLMDGGSGDDSMAGDNAIIWRRGDDFSPRFRELTETSIYTTDAETITANIDGVWQSDPADAVGRDIELLDHSDTTAAGLYGSDVMAGGADSDVMFGELANDLMQGDGAIASTGVGTPFLSRAIAVDDAGTNPDTDETLYFNIPELLSDADDYMEGNGGSDLMYGGLGQDDMIGGSSELFGLIAEEMRPDGSDVIFGGAGIDIDRNDIGDTTFHLASLDATDNSIITAPAGHARDADFIMGDNANVYRLVEGGASGIDPDDVLDAFLTFNYDNYGSLKIIPRAMQQLDYTLGGADYNEGTYVNGAAELTGQPADNGAADLIHGESGDDIIFGMTGSDVIFGEGQDDDIVGGYGHDWISGGTGQDGILGDDGLIRTSRNSTQGEPLNNVEGLLDHDPQPKYADGNVLDEVIKTPGEIQYAVINISGQLLKTVDLVPFSYDPEWSAMDDEFPDNQDDTPYADDIIFGGLGSDWLHGGSGDDAISGAEALAHAYVPTYDADGTPDGVLDLGYAAVGLPSPTNPGDVLAFNPIDLDGQHLNNRFRAGEFALYDEYDPLRKILLTGTGELSKSGAGYEFLLNFNQTEGVIRPAGTVPKATGQQTENYPAVNDDGKDAIFGDLGNDWLVGGTGRDNLYGGWGNDLLNADDDQTTDGSLNDMPDTHPYYEDRAYGGAGRDVLIANTGGDRLIDWVGEYNSYLVPYAPFGQASVSRTLQPFLPEFLYALSAGDGADPTRPEDTGADPLRNGEPDAEMGLVLQKDFAWQDQTGAPADPQAGNIPGGPRDVLRSANFNDGTAQGFVADSGTWSLKSGVYSVEPTVLGTDAVSVWYHDEVLPSYFELTATVSPVKPIAGYKANAYIVFDYYGPDDFKFAGLNSSNTKIEIGQRTADGWQVLTSLNMQVKAGTSYNLLLALNGTTATIVVDNKLSLSYGFAPRLDIYGMTHNFNDGMVGLGADNAKASIDNVTLRVVPPALTFTQTDDFSTAPALLTGQTGDWSLSKGYFVGTPTTGQSVALAGGDLRIGPAYLLRLDTKIDTEATGGIIFDQYSPDDFKWAAYSKATNQVLLGHHTVRDGWVIDSAVSRILSGDVTLTVTLKGTTVSVLVNGSAAVSHVYNAVVTDGGFGLLAKGGTASFDLFTVSTDDPSFAPLPQNLMATAAPEAAIAGSVLTYEELSPIVDAAIDRWEEILGTGSAWAATLQGVEFQIVDFSGLTLGQALPNTVFIDADAAGYGWFVDLTPEDDAEFIRQADGTLVAKLPGEAADSIDLLTAVMHELGHVLGLADLTSGTDATDLMFEALSAGVRRTETGLQMETWMAPSEAGIGFSGSVSERVPSLFDGWLTDWLRQYCSFTE